MSKVINIPGRLHDVSIDHITTGANEVFDDNKGKRQTEINTEVDNELADRYKKSETYSKSEVYNKTELNSMITTPDQQYVTLTAQSGDTLADIFDGITGAADTVYRVGSWDGEQYDTTKYAEYAFDGTNFVPLDVKEVGIDNVPTPCSENLVKSGGVFNQFLPVENNIADIIGGIKKSLIESQYFSGPAKYGFIVPAPHVSGKTTTFYINGIPDGTYSIYTLGSSQDLKTTINITFADGVCTITCPDSDTYYYRVIVGDYIKDSSICILMETQSGALPPLTSQVLEDKEKLVSYPLIKEMYEEYYSAKVIKIGDVINAETIAGRYVSSTGKFVSKEGYSLTKFRVYPGRTYRLYGRVDIEQGVTNALLWAQETKVDSSGTRRAASSTLSGQNQVDQLITIDYTDVQYLWVTNSGTLLKCMEVFSNDVVGKLGGTFLKPVFNHCAYRFADKIMPVLGKSTDSFFVCAPDLHWNFDDVVNYHLPYYINSNNLNKQCNIFTIAGDIIGTTHKTLSTCITLLQTDYVDMIKKCRDAGMFVFVCLGGHDFNDDSYNGHEDNSIANNFTKAQQRSLFIQPCIDNAAFSNSIYNPVISDTTDICYYYVDESRSKTRYIFLDECDFPMTSQDGINYDYNLYGSCCYSQTQLNWLIGLLNGAPEGWKICIFNHTGVTDIPGVASTREALSGILTAFVNKTTYSGSGSNDLGFSWSITADFTNRSATLIGLFKGHTHTESEVKISNAWMQITSSNAGSFPSENSYNYAAVLSGSIDGDVFHFDSDRFLHGFHYGRKGRYYANGVHKDIEIMTGDRWLDGSLQITE